MVFKDINNLFLELGATHDTALPPVASHGRVGQLQDTVVAALQRLLAPALTPTAPCSCRPSRRPTDLSQNSGLVRGEGDRNLNILNKDYVHNIICKHMILRTCQTLLPCNGGAPAATSAWASLDWKMSALVLRQECGSGALMLDGGVPATEECPQRQTESCTTAD